MNTKLALIIAVLFCAAGNSSLAQLCTDVNACNFNLDEPCVFPGDPCDDSDFTTTNDSFNQNCECAGTSQESQVLIEFYDLGNNGYTGTNISLENQQTGEVFGPFTLENGEFGQQELILPNGCYDVISTNDAQDDEVYFTVTSSSEVGSQSITGVANDITSLGVGVISGCLDPEAYNYNPDAMCDSGECYVCDIDGACDPNDMGLLAPAPCNLVTICGPGFYYIKDHTSGTVGSGVCKDIALPDKLGDYEVLLIPVSGTMEILYSTNKAASAPRCYYIDENGCGLEEFDWTKPKKKLLSMTDPCDLGWEGIRYDLCDEGFNLIYTGSLMDAEFGNMISNGFDVLDLPPGCYNLKFRADDCFYPCQEFSLINLDEDTPELSGIVSEEFFSFSIEVDECVYGCTDENALNYDLNATNECFGDNSCCEFSPANNTCNDAIPLETLIEYDWNTVNADASAISCISNPAPDLWYSYSSLCDMRFTLSAFSNQYPMIQVYEGCPDGDGQEIYCPEPTTSPLNKITIDGREGITYYIQLSTDSNISNTGNGKIELTEEGCVGCTNPLAENYDENADLDNGLCLCIECPGDFDGDGAVNISDLGGFLGAFGSSCFPPED